MAAFVIFEFLSCLPITAIDAAAANERTHVQNFFETSQTRFQRWPGSNTGRVVFK